MNLLLFAVLLLQAKTAEEIFREMEQTLRKANTSSLRVKSVYTREGKKLDLDEFPTFTLVTKTPGKVRFVQDDPVYKEAPTPTRIFSDGEKVQGMAGYAPLFLKEHLTTCLIWTRITNVTY